MITGSCLWRMHCTRSSPAAYSLTRDVPILQWAGCPLQICPKFCWLPEYAAIMKPVIPDYEWIIYGVRVTYEDVTKIGVYKSTGSRSTMNLLTFLYISTLVFNCHEKFIIKA